MESLESLALHLVSRGFAVLPGRYRAAVLAWQAAHAVIDEVAMDDDLCRRFSPLAVVAEYTMPPRAARQRAFQVLHIDFGLPLGRSSHADVARFTILYVDAAATGSGTATRIVPLAALASQRRWPPPLDVASSLRAREGDPDMSEGILARIVEAADRTSELPSKTSRHFACGLEFESIQSERDYLSDHGIDVAAVEQRVVLEPGQGLVLDNIVCAHGRFGIRATAELRQRCVGFSGLARTGQEAVLLHALAVLTGQPRPTDPTFVEGVTAGCCA